LWRNVRVILSVVFECFVITIVGVVGWSASGCGTTCLPGCKGTPVIGWIWEWRGRVKETVD